jgi:hypothetical protein
MTVTSDMNAFMIFDFRFTSVSRFWRLQTVGSLQGFLISPHSCGAAINR